MKARILQYRRSRHHTISRHYLLEIEGVSTRAAAQKLVGKKVLWKSGSGRKIEGRISAPHGSKGVVRAILERGLPGQALGMPVSVE